MTETVPAPATPKSGTFTDLTQQTPRGLLPAADRMHIARFAETAPNWAGTLLLPGEVTHWVQLSAGEIVSFQSFLTGRLASALGAGHTANAQAVSDTLSQPERLATHLRSAELHQDGSALLGHLIGAELAATRAFWLGADVRLQGGGPLAEAYESALKAQSAFVSRM